MASDSLSKTDLRPPILLATPPPTHTYPLPTHTHTDHSNVVGGGTCDAVLLCWWFHWYHIGFVFVVPSLCFFFFFFWGGGGESGGASGRLCFVIVAFPGYIHIFYLCCKLEFINGIKARCGQASPDVMALLVKDCQF